MTPNQTARAVSDRALAHRAPVASPSLSETVAQLEKDLANARTALLRTIDDAEAAFLDYRVEINDLRATIDDEIAEVQGERDEAIATAEERALAAREGIAGALDIVDSLHHDHDPVWPLRLCLDQRCRDLLEALS